MLFLQNIEHGTQQFIDYLLHVFYIFLISFSCFISSNSYTSASSSISTGWTLSYIDLLIISIDCDPSCTYEKLKLLIGFSIWICLSNEIHCPIWWQDSWGELDRPVVTSYWGFWIEAGDIAIGRTLFEKESRLKEKRYVFLDPIFIYSDFYPLTVLIFVLFISPNFTSLFWFSLNLFTFSKL